MSGKSLGRSVAIGDMLRQRAAHVEPCAPGRWRFALQNGKAFPAEAQFDGDWLTLSATPSLEPTANLPWRLLMLNGLLPGGARVTLDDTGEVVVGVDLQVGAHTPVAARVHEACGALIYAASTLGELGDGELACKRKHWDALSGPLASLRDDEWESRILTGDAWLELVRESGWPFPEPVGAKGISLGISFGSYGARVDHYHGEMLCRTAIIDKAPVDPLCREALAVLLLTATGASRMVRAAAAVDDRSAVHFEATLPYASRPSDVALTLGCLASACERFGREAEALLNEDLAAAYLTIRGRSRATDTDPLLEEPETILQGG